MKIYTLILTVMVAVFGLGSIYSFLEHKKQIHDLQLKVDMVDIAYKAHFVLHHKPLGYSGPSKEEAVEWGDIGKQESK